MMINMGVCLFGVVFLILSGLVFFKVWQAIATGEFRGRGSTTYRRLSPFTFWFNIIPFLVIGAWLLLMGLMFFGLVPKWFTELLKSMNSHGSR
jgi:hypothetical protein